MASNRSVKAQALMAQIAFDLEIGVEAERLGHHRALQLAAELFGQPGFGQIGDVRRHPRDREARGGRGAARNNRRRSSSGSAMIAWRPTSWKAMFCAECRAALAMHDAGADAVGIGRRPAQRLHPAHRPADDRGQRVDAEMIEQHRLRAHHVADGDDRETPCRRACPSRDRCSPGRTIPCSCRARWRRSTTSGRCRSACPARPSAPTSRACRCAGGRRRHAGRRSARGRSGSRSRRRH